MTPFPPHWIPFRANLWIAALLVPFLVKRRTLEALLSMATPATPAEIASDLSADAIVLAVKAVVARPRRMRGRRCLREGLLAFHYLSLGGHAPVLHFGIDRDSLKGARPAAHCWVSVGGRTILNPPDGPLLELFAYDGKTTVPASRLTKAQF